MRLAEPGVGIPSLGATGQEVGGNDRAGVGSLQLE